MIHLTLRKYCHRDFYEYYNATIRSLIIENNISKQKYSSILFCLSEISFSDERIFIDETNLKL